MSDTPEELRERRREYRARPEVKIKTAAYNRAYASKFENKVKADARRASPESRAKKNEYTQAYAAQPKNKAKAISNRATPERKASEAEYSARPEIRARINEIAALPENKAKVAAYKRMHNALPDIQAKAAERRALPEYKAKKSKQASLPKSKEKSSARSRHRRATDPQYRIAGLLRSRLSAVLKNKQKHGSAVQLLGCTIPELVTHLEDQFTDGMSWESRGLWHIDHILPLSSFDLEDAKQLATACHYTNLQPLWAFDNWSKGSKVTQ
jgi:hypothetical protein